MAVEYYIPCYMGILGCFRKKALFPYRLLKTLRGVKLEVRRSHSKTGSTLIFHVQARPKLARAKKDGI